MATMAKLPFVIAPKMKSYPVRLGNEDVGVIEIEKRGYLSVAEKSFVDSVMQGSDGVTSMVRLASKVARDKKISVEKAYNLIIGIISGSDSTALAKAVSTTYGDEISDIQSQMADSMQRKSIACATVLIQSRINSEWTVDDTMQLQPELLVEFSAFYDEEEQKVERKESQSSEEEAAEIVGK
jgi:hypothetical protein